jgi:hypothetical protein
MKGLLFARRAGPLGAPSAPRRVSTTRAFGLIRGEFFWFASPMRISPAFTLLALFALVVSGCSKSSHQHAASGGHAHTAPHGGTLIELGEHAYNLEFVRDRATGTLTVYVLDGHAENFVRIAASAIELVAMPGGQHTPVSLKPVANTATGETVGNTSQFEVQADWLKTAGEFAGIVTLDIKGTKFAQVPFVVK